VHRQAAPRVPASAAAWPRPGLVDDFQEARAEGSAQGFRLLRSSRRLVSLEGAERAHVSGGVIRGSSSVPEDLGRSLLLVGVRL